MLDRAPHAASGGEVEPAAGVLLDDRYDVQRELGRGGMGRVLVARDRKLDRDVAIKVVTAGADDPARAVRLVREARAAGALAHPNIVAVHDVGSVATGPYIVQELLRGDTLRERIRRGRVPLDQALDFAAQLARGLSAAHVAGVVHRDVKPENVFVTSEGWVKILDFGIATLRRDPQGPDTFTDPGSNPGTPAYMAPEQIQGGTADARTDLFSFGLVAYEMIAGRHPFERQSAIETAWAILHDAPPPLPDDVPDAVRRVVLRCLEKDPQARFQSARDLAFELELLRSGRPPPSRRAWARSAAVVVTVAAMVMGAWWLRRRRALPAFRQITFEGQVWTARFAPDGRSAFYAAATGASPLQIWSTAMDRPEPRAIESPPANLAAVSSKGELAVLVRPRLARFGYDHGTLARFFPGSAPRELVDDVEYADWSPDASALAVVRVVGSRSRLEYPLNHVLYEATGWVSHPRFSPDGRKIAFLHHPTSADNDGTVMLCDENGSTRALTQRWQVIESLAWAPSGDEIWFSAGATDESSGTPVLRAVTLSGATRILAQVTGNLRLQDVARDGRAIATHPQIRMGLAVSRTDGEGTHDLSWFDRSYLGDLSPDGKALLFWIEGPAATRSNVAYVRGTDGAGPPVRLGEGAGVALSPDGRWAVALDPAEQRPIALLPTRSGEPRILDGGGVTALRARWFPDGKRLLLAGVKPGSGTRLYVRDVASGEQAAISPEGVASGWLSISADGTIVAAVDAAGRTTLYPVAGGPPEPLPGIEPDEKPFGFASDGSLFVGRLPAMPLAIYRYDPATRGRTLHTRLTSGNGAQGIVNVIATADGKTFAFNYAGWSSDLFLLQGEL
jgi:Tol biopolymer transport system component